MQKKIVKKKIIMFIVAIGLLFCTITGGIVLAKYITETKSEGLVTTKNFYFTSNLLDGKTHTFAPGITSVTFTLGNHEDDLRYSETDITYTVTVDNTTVGITNATGTIAKGSIQDAEVTISNLEPGTYTITAVGTGGYKKTLTGTIIVLDNNPARLYYDTDTSVAECILLTVWNEGDALGTVTITYTEIPDNTNPNMSDWTTNGSKKVEIGPHESKEFRFFGGDVTVAGATNKTLN